MNDEYSDLLILINCLENDLSIGEIMKLNSKSIDLIKRIILAAKDIQK